MTKIALYADIKPTEDPDKVKQAIQNLFPDAQIDIQNTKLEAHSNTRQISGIIKTPTD